ncbi:NADPH--cytochrome P450 reductase [Platanthera guangdongensis]|uniref:NADPH--cytochrome P450 reductase n=1 Tax=Platanthera guangdongensis TaxID=2320717 RepID=A0ABR2MZY2_9ASPA
MEMCGSVVQAGGWEGLVKGRRGGIGRPTNGKEKADDNGPAGGDSHGKAKYLYFRKEQLWPELDLLLRDDDDKSSGTTYTTAVPEYHVVFIDPVEQTHGERSWSLANGHAVHDIQHPCRANVAVEREIHTPISDRLCIHLEFEITNTGLEYALGHCPLSSPFLM